MAIAPVERFFITLLSVLCLFISTTRAMSIEEKRMRAANAMLWDAAKSGDVLKAEEALTLGANINSHKEGFCVLDIVAGQCDTGFVAFLLEHGANVNPSAHKEITPLTAAVAHAGIDKERESTAILLLEHGADPNQEGQKIPPLHCAIENGNQRLTALLLAKGANTSASSYKGITPLEVAIKNGNPDIVQLLIENGANIQAQPSGYEKSLLEMAVKKDNCPVAQKLIHAGADVNGKIYNFSAHQKESLYDLAKSEPMKKLLEQHGAISLKQQQAKNDMIFTACIVGLTISVAVALNILSRT